MGRPISTLLWAVILTSAGAVQAAGWSSGVVVDKMSGAKTTVIDVRATDAPAFKGSQLKSRLAIQCKPKKSPEVFVDLGFPVSRASQGAARIKYDDAPPKSITGSRSDDGEALFLPNANSVIQSLIKAKDFKVEVTAVTQQQIVLSFPVGGLAEQKDALAACGIKVK